MVSVNGDVALCPGDSTSFFDGSHRNRVPSVKKIHGLTFGTPRRSRVLSTNKQAVLCHPFTSSGRGSYVTESLVIPPYSCRLFVLLHVSYKYVGAFVLAALNCDDLDSSVEGTTSIISSCRSLAVPDDHDVDHPDRYVEGTQLTAKASSSGSTGVNGITLKTYLL